jgi:hypothetical protein
MTDAVFLWVDGNDPEHQIKRSKYEQSERSTSLHRGAMLPTRYKDNNEIWYSINCLRTNAGWINRIFLVIDNQRPKWLSDETAKRLDISLIDHNVIFRDHTEHLPTFSSRAIETVIHRIPNISNEFIYLNDDFFIINNTTRSDYFSNRTPIVHGQLRDTKKQPALIRKIRNIFFRPETPGSIAPRAERKIFYPNKMVRLFHTPHSINKTHYEEYINKILEENIRYRFRDNQQMNPISYYSNMAIRDGKVILEAPDLLYIDPKLTHKNISIKELEEAHSRTKTKHLCIQSLEEFDSQSRQTAESFLDQFIY